MMLAVVRIKGKVNIKKEIERTLQLLKLYNKYNCVILPAKKEVLGMIRKVDRYVTWGEIEPPILKKLIEKRGRLPGNKHVTLEYIKNKMNMDLDKLIEHILDKNLKLNEIPGLKSFFKLKPPTKGFGKGGVRKPFSLGGVFGYRGKDINQLLERMI